MDTFFMEQNFFKKITRTIQDFGMIEHKDKILVAVSGGPDSVALVLSLVALKKTYDITMGIAHVNHMLRAEESLRDEAFVKTLAQQLGLPFFNEQKQVLDYARTHRLSIEEAGRAVRYHFFDWIAKTHGYQKIATGHTKNDNIELVLMNLLRGAGPKGLCGIPPIREGRYIRPMIRMSKSRILEFLNLENQAYMIDSSNADMAYLRNKIRYRLIPHLQAEYNPGITESLDRLSHILKHEEDFWEIETEKRFHGCLIKSETACLVFSKPELEKLHPAILKRVLRKAIQRIKTNLHRISLAHINDALEFCFNTFSGRSLDLPGQIRIYRNKDTIMIKKEKDPLRKIGKKEKKMKQMTQIKHDAQS